MALRDLVGIGCGYGGVSQPFVRSQSQRMSCRAFRRTTDPKSGQRAE